jgi:hypothetical protein
LTVQRFKRLSKDLAKVLDYVFDQFEDGNWPEDIWLALCRLAWPDRRFRVGVAESAEDPVYLEDLVDKDTGENAQELLDNAKADAVWLVQARRKRAEARAQAERAGRGAQGPAAGNAAPATPDERRDQP